MEYQERQAIVGDEQRHKRLRLLLRKLNKERKKQSRQIDILCNDLIGAQRNFIKRLNTISFIASFCESIIGTTDLNSLLATAVRIIKDETSDAVVSFFLRQGDDFQLHVFESPTFAPGGIGQTCRILERQHLEACFNHELMDNICKSNKVCTLDEMFALGLQGNPIGLARLSVVSIPLALPGLSLGFMLLARPSENRLTADEIERIASASHGLSRAIAASQALLHAAE
jgi:GAF domain-containing protein